MFRFATAVSAALLLTACTEGPEVASSPTAPPVALSALDLEAPARVRAQAAARGLVPMPPGPAVRPELAALGRALLFDPILSGNRDISCMTCHHPSLATGDARHLAIGQGATGLGPDRVHPEGAFIPRNAPPLFNLHVLDELFWDGRVQTGGPKGLRTPERLPASFTKVFEFGAISALGLLPVLSRSEMRGTGGNELAAVDDGQANRIWRALMARLGAVPEYVQMFEAAYPGRRFPSMNFAHASNAMAGFLVSELVFDDAPWDRFLQGDDRALTPAQLVGADIFTQIPCSLCHNGPALTDGLFHNVALAQLGPGQGDGPHGDDDFGRERVTGDPADRYAFRTTPLRNVELTGPYGHAGEFVSLFDFIDHYSESETKLRSFVEVQGANIEALLRGQILTHNFDGIMATRSPIIAGVSFGPEVAGPVTTFMSALTDDRARDLLHLIPDRVPSGLSLDPS